MKTMSTPGERPRSQRPRPLCPVWMGARVNERVASGLRCDRRRPALRTPRRRGAEVVPTTPARTRDADSTSAAIPGRPPDPGKHGRDRTRIRPWHAEPGVLGNQSVAAKINGDQPTAARRKPCIIASERRLDERMPLGASRQSHRIEPPPWRRRRDLPGVIVPARPHRVDSPAPRHRSPKCIRRRSRLAPRDSRALEPPEAAHPKHDAGDKQHQRQYGRRVDEDAIAIPHAFTSATIAPHSGHRSGVARKSYPHFAQHPSFARRVRQNRPYGRPMPT
ncbi:MAG: hypothetical protein JWN40_5686 [Phycisphaerales bacterium]|nr:hypothetical protein [Phycisphaerales bacterium]